ncbi:MAG: hypothetical protein J2P19_00070 [Pseudonocardia sp.]|nr:hypothetical protein [Pseudonocardia sp.]
MSNATVATYTARIVDPDESDYRGWYTEPQWVLEDEGEWKTDLDAAGIRLDVDYIEAAAAKALEVPMTRVTARPVGPNVSGDTSHRNIYVESDEWEIEVAP